MWRNFITQGITEHYGTSDELEDLGKRRIRSQVFDRGDVPLLPVDILDEGLVRVEPGQGYNLQGCVGACTCQNAYNPECAHETAEHIRELWQLLARRPELAEDSVFRQKVAAACEYARMMSAIMDLVDPLAAVAADHLELKLNL